MASMQRKGPKLGFLATAGFKDLLELQRQDRDSIYDLHYAKPRPLASKASPCGRPNPAYAGVTVPSTLTRYTGS